MMRLTRVALGFVFAAIAVALPPAAPSAEGADKLRVVTTIPDLRALTEAVGGDLVEVESLTRGSQNIHEVEVRPSIMLKIRRADVLVENGLELDAWVDMAVQGANNAKIVRGAPGRVDASRGIPVLEVPAGRVDRSMGDVHPQGNPHYSLDPGLAPIITQTIMDGLGRAAPQHRAAFEKNRQAFIARVETELARWTKTMEPFKGVKVVAYHPDFIYFLQRFGLVQVAAIEDRPGIPPSPGHLAQLIRRMKDERVKAVLVAPWNDQKLAGRVAQEAGVRAHLMAVAVGGVKGADTYFSAIDYNIRTLAEALR
jgi:ABC-type Zn uptake system ZnuABC Zn-binding protein ZnuA